MVNRTIDTVLFDADGVLQRPTVDWRDTLSGFVGPASPTPPADAGRSTAPADPDPATADPATAPADLDAVAALADPDNAGKDPGRADGFIRDLMTSEALALVGKRELAEVVAEVLQRWDSTTAVDDVLQVWSRFEAVPEIIAVVQDLRANGIECHLATNQHAYRRRIMHDERGYGDWFDQTFYSSDLGVAKPEAAYFRAILDAIGRPADSVLFIDDNPANVASARTVGLHAEQYELETGVTVLRDLLRRYNLPVSADDSEARSGA